MDQQRAYPNNRIIGNRGGRNATRGGGGRKNGPQGGKRGFSNAGARRAPEEAEKLSEHVVEKGDVPEEEEEFYCLICTEEIEEWGLGECNHREICAICSLRLRQLYKDLNCPVCKKRNTEVVHTRDKKKKFEEFDLKKLTLDSSLQTYFEFHEDWVKVRKLWELGCPICNSDQDSASPTSLSTSTTTTETNSTTAAAAELSATSVPASVFKKREVVFSSIKELKNHIKGVHGVRYCDLCLDFRKVFLHEQKLYTAKELTNHMDNGDKDNPEITAHQYCQFCNFYLYGIDELYEHMQKNHETCHLCTREGVRNQYFRDYQNLEKHFHRNHFLCPDRKCLADKFVVFANLIDLRAHEVQVHGGNMSRAEKKKKSTIDPSLVFAPPPRGGDRRREEPSNTSSNSIRTSSGANNTSNSSSSSSSSSSLSSSSSHSSHVSPTPSSTLKLEPPPTNPEEIKKRNQALINKVRTQLESEEKFNEFKKLSADFRSESLTPVQYVNKFLIFFHHSAHASEIFKELLTLLPDPIKRDALAKLAEPAVWQENLARVRREVEREKELERERKEQEEREKNSAKGKKNLAQSQPGGQTTTSGIWRGGSGLSQSDQAFPPLPTNHNYHTSSRTGAGNQPARTSASNTNNNNNNVWEGSTPQEQFPALPRKKADEWDNNDYYEGDQYYGEDDEEGYNYSQSGSSNASEYSATLNNLSSNPRQAGGQRGGKQSKKKQVLIKFG